MADGAVADYREGNGAEDAPAAAGGNLFCSIAGDGAIADGRRAGGAAVNASSAAAQRGIAADGAVVYDRKAGLVAVHAATHAVGSIAADGAVADYG